MMFGWKMETLRMRKERLKNCISKRVTQVIKSADGRKPATWRGGAQILKKEEVSKLLDRCEAKRKEWASTGNVTKACNTWMTSLGK